MTTNYSIGHQQPNNMSLAEEGGSISEINNDEITT